MERLKTLALVVIAACLVARALPPAPIALAQDDGGGAAVKCISWSMITPTELGAGGGLKSDARILAWKAADMEAKISQLQAEGYRFAVYGNLNPAAVDTYWNGIYCMGR